MSQLKLILKNNPMKTKILISAIFLLASITTTAQIWEAVGPDDDKQASSSNSGNTNLVFDSSGNPFVAYEESITKSTTEGFGTVKKFNGMDWEYVGTRGFTGDIPYFFKLALDNLDTPYVAYGDYLNEEKAMVKKFTGTDWVNIGTPGFSNGRVLYVSLAINSSGIPFIAYKDLNPNNTFTNVVKKFDGTDWVDVSVNQFTTENPNSIQILFDSSDNLFIAFVTTSGYKPTVKMLDGTDWIDVGTPKFSDWQMDYLSFNINSSDELYVSYSDGNIGYKPVVKKFDGTDWVGVGSPGFSLGAIEYTSIGFNDSNIPFIAYHDTGNGTGRGLSVKKFNGTQWDYVGSPAFSSGDASEITLSFDNSDIPLVVFNDDKEGNKVIVKKFDGSNWKNVGPRGFSKGRVNYLNLKTDTNNTPFAAFQDDGFLLNPAFVKMFDGNEWIMVGGSQASSNNKTAEFLSLAIDKNNIPHLAYRERSPYKIAVKKLNGNTWENLSNNDVSPSPSTEIDIEFNTSNTLFIAFKGEFSKPTVKMFDGNEWVLVGSSGLSSGGAFFTQMIIDSLDKIYVAYLDSGFSNGVVVKTFDGNDWIDLGAPGFINNTGQFFISVGPDNLPIIAFSNSGSITIMKFNGSDWVNRGSLNVPNSTLLYSLSVDANNSAYISYSEDPGEGRLQIKKLEQNDWVEVGSKTISSGIITDAQSQFDNLGNLFVVYKTPDIFSKKFATGILSTPNYISESSNILIYPNPVNDIFKIDSKELNISNINIYDYSGRLVKSILWNKESTNLNDLSPGMYILQIKTDEGITTSRKIIKK